jgi:Na+/H+-dicarboxylate symporter
MITPIVTNMTIAATLIPNALIQPVLNPLLKTYIHAIKAITIPIIFTEFPAGDNNTDDNILVETKYTIPYIIGPKAVTNIALVNFACFARRILADIHTGTETIAQRMKSEAMVITINKIEDSFIVDN